MTFSLENLKAAAESANPALKALSDLKFQGATQFMSPSQVAAAQTARQLYPAGTDWMQHLNDAAPQMAAFNEQLKQAADLSYNFLDTFNQGMLKGQGFAQSLTSALQGLESQLLQMVEKNLINQLFGSLLSGSSAGTTGGTGGILGGLFHTGGIVGGEGGSRYVSPAYFENAPRFHSGGILPGEVPAILKPGEGVFTPGQMRAMGSPSIQNNIQVVNQGGNSTAQVTSSKRNGTGGVDLVVAVTSVVNDKMVNGGFDQAMRGRYGIAPSARPR